MEAGPVGVVCMSQLNPSANPLNQRASDRSGGSLWPIAIVVMLVVFGPAMLAWAIGMIHN